MKTQKTYKTYLKPFKRDQKQSFSQKNCKRYLESTTQNSQVFQLKWLSTELTLLMCKKIADEYHNFFLNIGTDLANKLYLIFIQLKLILAWNLNRYHSMNWKMLFPLKINKSPHHDEVSISVLFWWVMWTFKVFT